MIWFKYTEDRWADAIIRGEIRLSRLATYSDSVVLGDAVGDPDEATKTVHVDYFDSGDQPTGEMFHGAINLGRHSKIINSTFRTTFSNLYGFCASTKYSNTILERFARENAEAGLSPYDTCVRIENHVAFRDAVTAAAKAKELTLVAYGDCVYCRRTFKHGERLPSHSGMLKKEEHGWQHEARLVYVSQSADDLTEHIDIQVPSIVRMVKKVV